MKWTSLLLTLFFGFSAFVLGAQNNGTIRGTVYDKESGEPIIFGTIRLEGTTIGTNTNENGFFSIGNVPPGNYTLVATYVGYDSVAVDIELKPGGIVTENIFMVESGVQLGVVNISARAEKARSDVRVSKITVTPQQIKSLPSMGGQADVAQYLPVLPGIISTGDQGGQIYIRGGSPIQNKILLDGMTIYNAFHSIGFFSVFETEIIRTMDVLTGGFNAEYGGRISAIVDIKTREGNKRRFSGTVSGNPFQTKVLFEGPLKKLDESGRGGSTSFILTGKHSYLDKTSPKLYSYATENDTLGLPYSFTDFYAKLSSVTDNGSKFNLFGFRFDDMVNFEGVARFDWTSNGGGANFTVVPPNSNLIIDGTLAFSDYEILLREADEDPRRSAITSYNAVLNFTYYGLHNEVKYGFDLNALSTDFRFKNFLGNTINQDDNTTELSGYIKYKQKLGPWILEPSVRLVFYASQRATKFEPRFGAKWNITDNLRFKAAGGFYTQNLLSSVNDRDVVNLFVGFLSGPEEQ
ncbi:MAG: TonB-dependent receptor, partial [Bacteroidetes bacterium]